METKEDAQPENGTAAPRQTLRVLNLVGGDSRHHHYHHQQQQEDAGFSEDEEGQEDDEAEELTAQREAWDDGGDRDGPHASQNGDADMDADTDVDTLEPHRAGLPPLRPRIGMPPGSLRNSRSGDDGQDVGAFGSQQNLPEDPPAHEEQQQLAPRRQGQAVLIEDDGTPGPSPLHPGDAATLRLGGGGRGSGGGGRRADSPRRRRVSAGSGGSASDSGSVDYRAVEADARAESRTFQVASPVSVEVPTDGFVDLQWTTPQPQPLPDAAARSAAAWRQAMETDSEAEEAAVRIQAAFRGGKARRHVDIVRARKDLRLALAAARSVPGSLQPEVRPAQLSSGPLCGRCRTRDSARRWWQLL